MRGACYLTGVGAGNRVRHAYGSAPLRGMRKYEQHSNVGCSRQCMGTLAADARIEAAGASCYTTNLAVKVDNIPRQT